MLIRLPALMSVVIDGEAAAAFADVHGDVVGIGLVTAGPRETRSQTQYLVVLRAQRVLLLPAVHPRVDDGHLVLGVEEHVLAALVGRVDELEGESAGRHDGDVGQVAVPVLVGEEMTLVDARMRRRPDRPRRCRRRRDALPRRADTDERCRQQHGSDDRKRRVQTAHARG